MAKCPVCRDEDSTHPIVIYIMFYSILEVAPNPPLAWLPGLGPTHQKTRVEDMGVARSSSLESPSRLVVAEADAKVAASRANDSVGLMIRALGGGLAAHLDRLGLLEICSPRMGRRSSV